MGDETAADEPAAIAAAAGTSVHRLGRLADLKRGGGTSFRIGSLDLGVFHMPDGSVRVIDNTCLHVGGPLSEGFLIEGCVVCPWHGWTYELDTGGRRTADGTVAGVRSYRAWVEGGDVWVEVPTGPPPSR